MKKPKKPSLSSMKQSKFSDMLIYLMHKPNSSIVSSINSKRFSLSGNDLFMHKTEQMAFNEYKRCCDLFERRLPREHRMSTGDAITSLREQMESIGNVISNKEMKIVDKLQDIAVETVRHLLDIPEHVRILPEIDNDIDLDVEQDDSPDEILSLTYQQQKEVYQEAQKRIILNGLVHGSAMHIWKSAHYIIKEEVDKLSPILMDLYDQYTTSVSWLIWQVSPSQMMSAIGNGDAVTQGFNKIDFDEVGEPDCEIQCSAINFPVLLHEVTKGAMDYLICHGIPSHFTAEMLTYYYSVADDYANEFWHYLISPSIWIGLVEAADVDTQSLPKVIQGLCSLSYNELTEVLSACVDGEVEGNLKLKKYSII